MESTDKLFLHHNQFYELVSGQGSLLIPQPETVRAIFSTSADLKQALLQAHGILQNVNVSLFCNVKADRDVRVGFLYEYKGTKQILLDYGATPWAAYYEAKSWPDMKYNGNWGFLITGLEENSVWRIIRAEPDHINRARLTLREVAPTTGLPQMDFSRVRDQQLRTRIESSWAKLQEHVTNRHGDEIATASKNIMEGLLAELLAAAGHPHGGNLVVKLERVERLMESDPSSSPLGELEFHLAQKIRLMHQRTHPERAVKLARQMRPEFALGCVEDLIEILTAQGFAQGEP